MAQPYRLIALDIDGTLLNDDHELTAGTKEAVRRAYDSGISIVLCTGRGPSNTFYLCEELGLPGVLITHNGATTLRSDDRSVLHSFSFELAEAARLLEYCRTREIHYDANTVFDMYVDRVSERVQAMYDKFGIQPIHLEDVTALQEPVMKFTMFGSTAAMDQLEADWTQVGCSMLPIRSGEEFIDIMHPEASKGNALRILAQGLGIQREEILAIGNYFNDVDMLRFAGKGIAMSNSPDGVKAAADEVTTGTNNEDGVRMALEKYVFI